MPEVEARCRVSDPSVDHVEARTAAEAGSDDQHLLHPWIGEREPLLQEVDTQHHLQWDWRSLTLGGGLVVKLLDQ